MTYDGVTGRLLGKRRTTDIFDSNIMFYKINSEFNLAQFPDRA